MANRSSVVGLTLPWRRGAHRLIRADMSWSWRLHCIQVWLSSPGLPHLFRSVHIRNSVGRLITVDNTAQARRSLIKIN